MADKRQCYQRRRRSKAPPQWLDLSPANGGEARRDLRKHETSHD